ncbi:MAG TPA: zinc metalloprotease HtpX, partial [Candidatus Paceibacterota bacterium]|nr:zinc metalloprotease HtpX [Candidatus Paceibacterota bacterium]
MYHSYDSNIRKTWALMSVFFIVVIGVGFAFAQVYGDFVILYIAVLIAIVMNFFSYWYSDKIVLSISGARPADKETYWDLYTVTE